MNHNTYSFKWFERFGNNIQQISNLIMYCEHNNVCGLVPDHQYINSFKINEHLETENIRYNKFFNCWNFNSCHLWDNFTKQRHQIIKNKIYPNLKFKDKDINILSEDDLVIHIRSGEIFRPHNTRGPERRKFVQSPLSFFTKIIEQYNKIYICSENRANPVIDSLSKNPKTTIYIGRSIIDDILLILSSKNVCVSGVGTFGLACCMLSQNLKNFYSTDLDPKTFLNYHNIDDTIINKTIISIDQNKYIKLGSWSNSPEQRKIMLEYQI